ncbi:MAG: putative ski2-type helicase [Methanomassiliicoccales archaeon PtaU1.Bin124]|nr:MAG: putative ski2-type helicase [Methanomassiliicoccales archaeon PtaU1.Bin124]
MFIDRPLIKKDSVEQRDYQVALAKEAVERSTLVVLPTGMGKTVVALLTLAEVLHRKGGKVLLLAPTKPLVEQHSRFLQDFLVGKKVAVMTGEVSPEEREALWIENDVIASTPQVVANDLKNDRVRLDKVNLIIFDEAHRAVGNYAYVAVAAEYKNFNGLVLGMTASPGSQKEKVKEVCDNLGIVNIEVRTEHDPDVAKYVQDVNMEFIELDLPPELRKASSILTSLYETYLKELVNMGLIPDVDQISTKDLLALGNDLSARLKQGERSKSIYRALSVNAMAIKVEHAIDLAETQGSSSLIAYLDRLSAEADSDEGSKASRVIVETEQFKAVREMMKNVKVEHPKLSRVMTAVARQIAEKPASKVLVFTHYRDTCDMVASKLSRVEGVRVAKLVGQADRVGEKGLRQKEQVGVLQQFREGEYNVLVATSVGEEGLDVASTDLVVFYEPVPSEIRSIQRKGRTGRRSAGKVIIFMTKGTRDQAYYFSSARKEKAMKSRLLTLKRELESDGPKDEGPKKENQRTLFDF